MSTDLVHLTDRGDIGAVMRPVGSVTELRQAFESYQELTRSLLTDDDYQTISRKRFPKKSAWRKLSTAFGVTFSIKDRSITYDDAGHVLRAEFVITATAPNGRSMDGWGGCDLKEKCCGPDCKKKKWADHTCCASDCTGAVHFSHPNHDIPATAETRSKNRAASDLFGMGEVSAEEVMDSGEGEPRQAPAQKQAPKPADQPVQQRKAAAATPNSHGDLVARIRAVLPEDHPQYATLSAKPPKQLEALAKSLKIDVDSPAVRGLSDGEPGKRAMRPTVDATESPSPEGEGPGDSGSSPEGDYADHWESVAKKASLWIDEVLVRAQTFPEGKDLSDLKELYGVGPETVLGKKLEKALIGKKESAA